MNNSTANLQMRPKKNDPNPGWWQKCFTSEWFIFLLIMLLAVFFFFYRLPMIPSEFNIDEWSDAYDALDMIENGFKLFSPVNYGREMFFASLVSIGFRLFGAQDLVLRGIGAMAGILTVGTSYFLAKEVFKRDYPNQARWIAALTSLGLVVSFWQLLHLRMGRRHTLLPLFITLALYFLWHGFNKGSRWSIVAAGFFMGVAMHTYPASRFVPIAVLIFLVIEGAVQWFHGHPKRGLWRQYWLSLLLMFVVAGLIFLPLGLYFVFDQPDQFLNRANQVSVFNDEFSQGSTIDTIWDSFSGNLLGLFWHGDEDGGYNIPGRPMFNPIMFAAFVVGLGLTLKHYRHPNFLFVFLWCLLLMVPAFLVADRIPAFKRSIGIIPVINIVTALGWITFSMFVSRWRRHPRLAQTIAVAIPLVAYLATGIVTYRDYFLEWGPSRQEHDFVLMYEDIAHEMQSRGQANELWIFPQDPRLFVRRYYGLNGLVAYPNLPPRAFITTDEQEMFNELTSAAKGFEQAVLVDVRNGQEWQADPKGVFPFLLEKFGTLQRRVENSDQNYTLNYYQLDFPEVTFQPAHEWQPVDVNFGTRLKLSAAAFGDASGSQPADTIQIPSGETVWVTLRWQALEALPADYHVSLRLTSKAGHVVGQVDRALFDAQLHTTSKWQQGTTATDYYLLHLEPGTVPGDYALEVQVYEAQNGIVVLPDRPSRITPGAAAIAQVPVSPSTFPQPVTPARPIHVRWAQGVYLEGTSALPESIQPGSHFPLALVWSNETETTRDIDVNIELWSGETTTPLLSRIPVGGASYRTSQWRTGETIQQWLTLQIPAEIAPGNFDLRLNSTAGDSSIGLGKIRVEPGRLRRFELPPAIQHPINATFGSQIKLLGYDLALTDRLNLTLYWQALDSMPESYKVFVHVLDPEGQIVIQKDQIPVDGEAPTSGWLAGEVIADNYQFTMPVGTVPAGNYYVGLGLYEEITGERLPASGNEDTMIVLPEPIQIGN